MYDLQYASPATVSRCDMVYIDPKDLGYNPFWQKWVNSRTNKLEKDNMHRLYEKYVPILIDMVVEGLLDGRQGEKMKTIIPLTNLNMVSYLPWFNLWHLCFPLYLLTEQMHFWKSVMGTELLDVDCQLDYWL